MGRNECVQNCNICIYSPNTCNDAFVSAIDKGKCGSYCADCSQSCLICDGEFKAIDKRPKYNINFSYFKPYFDVTLGREVSSMHEIKEHCKRNDMVYAGDKELTQQCEQNKKDNVIKQDKAFEKNLTEKLMGIA